jgi:hypothetical protein
MRRCDKEKWRGGASRLSRTVGCRRLQPSGERKKRPFHGARRRTATPMRRCSKRRLEPDPRLLAGHFARHRTRFAHPKVQLDMSDYKSNVALYPTFQEYFRTHTPPLLAALGAETTHSSCRRGPRCSSATSRTRLCASSIPDISRRRRMPPRSRRPFAASFPE